jgi:DNA-nicking Smr family endonuclease
VRKLSPEEEALWARVMATVQPLDPSRLRPHPHVAPGIAAVPALAVRARRPVAPPPPPLARRIVPGTTLDASWDRKLARGEVAPDVAVDLHGLNLADAYDLLDSSLARAISGGARMVLLVTGKLPRGEPPIARGRIRAAIHDWLAASPHAGSIAAVRGAHPRHGGTGALYIILRRRRSSTTNW